MDRAKIADAINLVQNIMDENRIYAGVTQYESLPVLNVTIEWGDWRHEHHRARQLLEEKGFMYVGQTVVESDGSDTYTAIHRFIIPE